MEKTKNRRLVDGAPPVMFVGEHNPIQLYSYLRIINYGYDIVMFTNLANELGPQNG